MRSILAGLLLLLMAGSVLAQTKGEVESIGFGGYIRPDTWNPMVVRIRPGTLEAGYYQIQVEQKDNDEDTQVFTRVIQVNASEAAREQRYWMYFLPQTVRKGLPDGGSVRDLSAEMKVWLCNKDGKQIEPLPLTSTVRNVDVGSTFTGRGLGRKLVLCVSDGSSRPVFDEYVRSFGVPEDVLAVLVRPYDLPESVLGYDGVDAVVWTNGNGDELNLAGSTRLPALTQFVKLGGRLIVTQPAERGKVEALEPLLPVQLKDAGGNWLIETRERTDLLPLRSFAKPVSRDPALNPWLPKRDKDTQRLLPFGPFKVTRASAVKPGALVAETIDWNATEGAENAIKDPAPYIVRWGVGLGQVTWVAQDLGDGSLTRTARSGWIGVWDKVLDLKSDPTELPAVLTAALAPAVEKARAEYGEGGAADLGYSYLEGIEHSARGAGLVVLAIGFFIVYWAAAGPISYFVLANKKKRGASWPVFAASALVATAMTVGVVRLVMGASAAVKHISIVRWSPNQPAVVESRVGVYLTKSNVVTVALNDAEPDSSSYVSAFNPHPTLWESGGGFVGKQRYPVWVVKDEDENTPQALNVPFRSTLKKLQARWAGQLPGIEGRVTLNEPHEREPRALLTGRLTNSTGRDLRHVYIAFTARRANGEGYEDILYYLPGWRKGQTIDLDKELTSLRLPGVSIDGQDTAVAVRPSGNKVIRDTIPETDNNWVKYWFSNSVRNASGSSRNIADDAGFQRSFPLMSLYERLPVVKRIKDGPDRMDLKRLGVRKFDMSPAVSAGQLVILAQDAANDTNGKANSPLPYPLEVDGDQIPGSGVTFYQFALPMTRVPPPPPPAPATPTTGPTTEPAVEK